MPNYRRLIIPGGTYFFTSVTYQRRSWLCEEVARQTLRSAIDRVRGNYPFTIDAIVLLPDHIHSIWTLPEGDSNFAIRWSLIKRYVTRHCGSILQIDAQTSVSRQKRKEGNLWQRRYWEHLIRDEEDFAHHCDYIHYNPVKHGLCQSPKDWSFSSFHRFVSQGIYPNDWACDLEPHIPEDIGHE